MAGQIYELITKVMADVPVIKKLREHQEQKWKYRGYEDFLAAFRPALLAHGLFIAPEVLDTESGTITVKNGREMRHILVKVAYTIFAPDGSMVRSVVIGESWDAQDNASTKAMDDAFTTFLAQVFCVPTGDSPAEKATGATRKPAEGAKRQEKSPPTPSKSSKSDSADDIKPSADVDLDARAERLVAENRVSRDGSRYNVKPNDKVTYEVWKNDAGRVVCQCERFVQASEADPAYRCEHIRAVKLFTTPRAVADQPSEGAPDPRPKTLGDLVTPKQIWMLRSLAKEGGFDAETQCMRLLDCPLEEISKRAASSLIDEFKRMASEAAA